MLMTRARPGGILNPGSEDAANSDVASLAPVSEMLLDQIRPASLRIRQRPDDLIAETPARRVGNEHDGARGETPRRLGASADGPIGQCAAYRRPDVVRGLILASI